MLPKESWTIHGLWPDLCDGTFRKFPSASLLPQVARVANHIMHCTCELRKGRAGQYCDLERQFDPRPSPNTTNGLPNGTVVPVWEGGDVITPTLEKWGKYDLLAHMNKYFKSRFYPGTSKSLSLRSAGVRVSTADRCVDWDLWAHGE